MAMKAGRVGVAIREVDQQGRIRLDSSSLPIATDNRLGGVKIGSGINVTSAGVISVDNTLPIASETQLGGVKVGSNLSVTSEGVLSADAYTLPVATGSTLGGVKVGTNLNVTEQGTLSVPTGTASQKGVMQAGEGLSVASGTVSVSAPTATTIGGLYARFTSETGLLELSTTPLT